MVLVAMLVQLACYCNCSSSWYCCCCWDGGDDDGVGSVGAAPGVAAAALPPGVAVAAAVVVGVGVAAAGCGCSSSSLLRFAWFLSSGGAAVIGSVDVFVFPSLCFKASPFSPLLFFYLVSSLPILSQ